MKKNNLKHPFVYTKKIRRYGADTSGGTFVYQNGKGAISSDKKMVVYGGGGRSRGGISKRPLALSLLWAYLEIVKRKLL